MNDDPNRQDNSPPRQTDPSAYFRRGWESREEDDPWADDAAWAGDEAGPLLDGEALFVEETAFAFTDAWDADRRDLLLDIQDQYDDIIIAGLQADRLAVEPGEAATYQVHVLNNGPIQAVFHVRVEGWLDERWITIAPVSATLEPGQRATLEVVITPERASTSRAGEHALAIVTRSPNYPGRRSALAATLVIAPFMEIIAGVLHPGRTSVGWNRRARPSRLPIINRSNSPATIRVSGQEITRSCRFEFALPNMGRWQADELEMTLEAGETGSVQVRVTPSRPRLFGLSRELFPYRIMVRPQDETHAPQSVPGRVENRPLIGVWHLVATLALAAGALMLALLVGMGSALLWQSARMTRPSVPTPIPAPQSAPPIIAIMLNNSPPTSQPEMTPAPVVDAPVTGDAPIVQADQVSAPNPGAPEAPGNELPVTRVAPPLPSGGGLSAAPDAGLTYGEMFRMVALQYDLDWRMLAAQAYIESNFNTLALGADGDLGLMQILPGTWREWSPAVGVDDPFDAYSNTLVAAAYLDHLRTVFAARGLNDSGWMLVAYNWGPDKVIAHLESGQGWEQLASARRRYAERILEIANNIALE